MAAIKWWRQYDGGQFTATLPGCIEAQITLKDSSGKFRHMRRYEFKLKHDGQTIATGSDRLLQFAKDKAVEAAAGFVVDGQFVGVPE